MRHTRPRSLLLGGLTALLVLGCSETHTPVEVVEPNIDAVQAEGTESDGELITPQAHDPHDLTTENAWAVLADGGLAQSGPLEQGTGAGGFPAFLLLGRTSDDVGKGYNTDARGGGSTQYEIQGGSNTRSVPLNSIPAVIFQADPDDPGSERTVFREFRFDGQAPTARSIYSLDDIRIYLVPNESPNNAMTDFLTEGVTGPRASLGDAGGVDPILVWDMNPGLGFDFGPDVLPDYEWLRVDAELSSGQGQDDVRLLVPEALFQEHLSPEDATLCGFDGFDYARTGSTTGLESDCPWLIYFVQAHGWADSKESGTSEWAVALRPVIDVTKTAVGSFDREIEWSIEKSVDEAEHKLETSQSGDSEYTVTVTREGEKDFNHQVSGTITMENTSSQSVEITAIEDLLEFDGADPVALTFDDLDCPDIPSLPHAIPGGEERSCAYSVDVEVNGLPTGTNSVQVRADDPLDMDGDGFELAYGTSTPVAWDDEPTNVLNEEVNVEDSMEGDLGSFTDTESVSYTHTFTCDEDEGLHENTATIKETGQKAEADVAVECIRPELEVEKVAFPSFDREYFWDIEKDVDIAGHVLAVGDEGASEYTVTVTQTGFEDSNHRVSGTITIKSTANYATAEISGVTDEVGDIPATVECREEFPHELGPDDELECRYWADLPDDTRLTNTATASVTDDSPVDGGSGTAPVDFADVEPTNVTNDEVNVEDSVEGSLGTFSDTGVVTYTHTFVCFDDEGEHPNTATIIETEQQADADVTVECLDPDTETAWASNEVGVPLELPFNPDGQGNWATYVAYDGTEKITTFFAGQTNDAGTVTFSAPSDGQVTITIQLAEGWTFAQGHSLAVQDYADAPSGNPAPGQFEFSVTPGGDEAVITGIPENAYYAVHGVVVGGGS